MTVKPQSKQSRSPKSGKSTKAGTHETAARTSKRTATPNAKPERKIDKVIALLEQSDGTTMNELVAATDWQPHTTRAALTGLKKKGHIISSEKIDAIRRYRLAKPQ
jgi:hypothetical protein